MTPADLATALDIERALLQHFRDGPAGSEPSLINHTRARIAALEHMLASPHPPRTTPRPAAVPQLHLTNMTMTMEPLLNAVIIGIPGVGGAIIEQAEIEGLIEFLREAQRDPTALTTAPAPPPNGRRLDL